jgi:DNA-binding CsgD family transcriptional regulator
MIFVCQYLQAATTTSRRKDKDLTTYEMPNPLPTMREVAISDLLSKGMTHKEIGNELGIAEKTVAAHMFNLHQKIGAKTGAHTVALMAMLGYISLGDASPGSAHMRARVADAVTAAMESIVSRVVETIENE